MQSPYATQQPYSSIGGYAGGSPAMGPYIPTDRLMNTMDDKVSLLGHQLEEQLTRVNTSAESVFFLASGMIVFGGVVGLISSFAHFKLANMVDEIFMIFFGLFFLIINVSSFSPALSSLRLSFRKYARFTTHLMGQSIAFLYLSSATAVALWPEDNDMSGSGLLLFVAIVVSFVVFAISVLGIFFALFKRRRLEEARKVLNQDMAALGRTPEQVYQTYAKTSYGSQIVLSPGDLQLLFRSISGGSGILLDSDVALLYNAIDTDCTGGVSISEFLEWYHNPTPYV